MLLAKLLRDNIHGYRPVSLIGQGIGSRVVFYALEELAKTDSQGIIEDVIIMGAPCTSSSESWLKIRNIVAGRSCFRLLILFRSSLRDFRTHTHTRIYIHIHFSLSPGRQDCQRVRKRGLVSWIRLSRPPAEQRCGGNRAHSCTRKLSRRSLD